MTDASETFNEFHIRTQSDPPAVFLIKIFSGNNQSVIVPMATGLTEPGTQNPFRMLTPVYWNNTRVVNHFIMNYDMIRCLNDSDIVVVWQGDNY